MHRRRTPAPSPISALRWTATPRMRMLWRATSASASPPPRVPSWTNTGVMLEADPLKIVKLPTDNGKEFTGRLFASRERETTGQHEFNRLCADFGIALRFDNTHDQCDGGALRRPRWQCAEDASLQFRRRPAANAIASRGFVQPTTPAVRAAKQNIDPSTQRLMHITTAFVQEASL